MKKTFYSEFAYLIGVVVLALGTALVEKADFGVSMVVAPAYLLHLKLSPILPFFTFGMAEYTLQAVILLIMIVVVRKFRWSYLFSFVTAVFYGLTLDGCMFAASFIPDGGVAVSIALYAVGFILCVTGIAFLFRTYIAPEAYELFVKEISAKYNLNINRFKTIYDCVSCAVAIVMSFAFFGWWNFEGIGVGTIICTLLNGFCIGRIGKMLDKCLGFKDGLKFRRFFE